MSLKNKIITSFSIIIAVMILSSVFVSYNINKISDRVTKLEKRDFQAITKLLEADRDSYQSNLAISQIFSLIDEEKIEKSKKTVDENLIQLKTRIEAFKKQLKSKMKDYQSELINLDKYYNLTQKNTRKIFALLEKNKKEEAKEFYFDIYLKDYESMRTLIDFFSNKTYKFVKKDVSLVNDFI